MANGTTGKIQPPTYADSPTVKELKRRIERLGIPLDRYLIVVTDCWDGSPKGFKFVCANQTMAWELYKKLDSAAPRIAQDAICSQLTQDGKSWREVSQTDSLHIIWLQGRPNDHYANPKVNSYYNIHLDTVSICKQVEASGRCELDYPKVPQHIWRDLWHGKLPLPKVPFPKSTPGAYRR
jgi:hypothetical protein